MIRTYTILSTNNEMMTSPYINGLKRTFDIALTANEPKVVNFLFQFPITADEAKNIEAIYDNEMIELSNLYIECFSNQTLASAIITAKDVGSFNFSFSMPFKEKTSHWRTARFVPSLK